MYKYDYNIKHLQALDAKFKHFLNLEKTTLKFKHFQGFQGPVRTLYIALEEQCIGFSGI